MAAWTQFIMPGIMVGAGMYVKHKQAQAVKWFMGPEETARGIPFALLIVKIQTGTALPQPASGYKWKKIQMTVVSSPFAPAEVLDLNVLDQVSPLAFPLVPKSPTDQGLVAFSDLFDALGCQGRPCGSSSCQGWESHV